MLDDSILTETLKLLIENGARATQFDYHGSTLFHSAVARGLIDIVRLLIQKGVDVNCSDLEGNTPLAIGILKIREKKCETS
jgi:ankyrin repeat protein